MKCTFRSKCVIIHIWQILQPPRKRAGQTARGNQHLYGGDCKGPGQQFYFLGLA